MLQCKVLKTFPFSLDGIKVEHAEAGTKILLPARLAQGLEKAGYIAASIEPVTTVAINEAPETKVIEGAPEVKPAWLK